MLLDATALPDRGTLEAEVCIVGAGPAGLTLARQLGTAGVSCLLLESGGTGPDSESQDLNAGGTEGDAYPDLRHTRSRGIGGTATIWNTHLGENPYAKYVPFDPIDFERRAGVPEAGWPFALPELEPFYHRAQDVCGIGPFDYSVATWAAGPAPVFHAGDGGLRLAVYQLGPAARFTSALPAALDPMPEVSVLRGATVIGIEQRDERITAMRWASRAGRTGTVRAIRFVLSAGAIENARLLLALGISDRGWLGRGFMEHPVDHSLRLVPGDPALFAPAGFFGARPTAFGAVVGRIGLSPELLRAERLPNATIRLALDDEPAALGSPGLRSMARKLVPIQGVRRTIGNLVRRTWRTGAAIRQEGIAVRLDLEQAPHRENRIVLSDAADRFGVRRAVLRYRFRPDDEERRLKLHDVLVREMAVSGVARLVRPAPAPLELAVHHHAGTTRISVDPGDGVVDPDCRVHQLENLFVTGASVFPTAGVANPTLTVVAMALRLAHHLEMMSRG